MKLIALILAILSMNSFALAGTMYHYTFTTRTQKCAVDIYVPTTGKIVVEKLCFNLSK